MTTKEFHDILDVCAEEICGTEDTVSANGDDLFELEEVVRAPLASLKEEPGEDSKITRMTRSRASSQEGSGEELGGVPSTRARADSGALLDMLAEVASQKLLFSPMKRRAEKSASDEGGLPLSQVKGLSTNQLIKIFSTTEFNEMKKLYSFHCAFDASCDAKFMSFGNENRAKEKFKAHLMQHLETLKVSEEDLKAGTRRRKGPGRGRGRGKMQREEREVKLEMEIKKEVEEIEEPQVSWDEQLLDTLDLNPHKQSGFLFEERGPKVEVEMVTAEKPVDLKAVAQTSAALDLNKLIAGLTEKMGVTGVVGEHSYSTAEKPKSEKDDLVEEEEEDEDDNESKDEVKVVHPSEELRHFMDIEAKDPVMVCVIEGDSVVLKRLPQVAEQVDIESSSIISGENIYNSQASPTAINSSKYSIIRSSDLPVIADNRSNTLPTSAYLDPSAIWELSHGVNIERDEFQQSRKPKGKAKFIGQSKIEKERALEAIDAIRRKTGGGGLDTLQCTICQPPRSFTAPTTLISHYRSHAGIKPYECRMCRAVFTRQHSLNYHMLIHSNQTRFTCQDCGRRFRHPSHFKEHRRRHTGESPFECSDCLMRFKTRNTYKRHLRTRHGKVLTTSGGLIILSEDEFQMVRTVPRQNTPQVKRGRPRKIPHVSITFEDQSIDNIDEDIQSLHQLEIAPSNEANYEYGKDSSMDIDEMPVDFITDDTDDTGNSSTNAAYEEIVKEAVRLEKAEKERKLQQLQTVKQNKSYGMSSNGNYEQSDEETIVIETEDPLTSGGLFLATLDDGQTVLVNADEDDTDVDMEFKVVQVGGRNKYLIAESNRSDSTVIVIKNEPLS